MTNIPVWSGEEMLVKKTGCQCFIADVMQSFQSDNHVYCTILSGFIEIAFKL